MKSLNGNLNDIETVTLEQAERCVIVCMAADVACMLWGKWGVGKSSIMRQIADKLNWLLFDYRVSDKQPSDTGCPVPVHESRVLDIYVPRILPFERVLELDHKEQGGKDAKGILFLDELDRPSDEGMKHVSLQLLLDKAANGQALGKNIKVVAAGNGPTDTDTLELNDAQRSRVAHFYVDDCTEQGLEGYLDWAEKEGISSALRSFAKFRTDVWGGEKPQFVDEARKCKRSWDNADRLLRACDSVSFKTEDIKYMLIAGCVGQEDAPKFLAWWKAYKEMPDPESILTDPQNAVLPEKPDVQSITGQTVVDLVIKGDKKRNKALVQYVLRLPDEITEAVVMDMGKKDDTILALPEVVKFLNTQTE